MALIDRIDHTDPDSSRHINKHAWSGAMWFFAEGDFTRAQIVTAYNMTVEDEVQLDQLIIHFQGLTPGKKAKFHNDLEAAGNLLEDGKITSAQYLNLLGLS